MSTKVEIANLALRHLGVSKPIANFDTENSEEARACRLFFDIVTDAVLRDFQWPFATRIEALALIEENPNVEWAFSYQYPVACASMRRILSGVRNDNRSSRIPYRIVDSDSNKNIFTDMPQAQAEFTVKITNVAKFTADFQLAHSFRLANYIAASVIAGDPFKLGDRALQMYLGEIDRAKANASNEEQDEELPDSEFVLAREGGLNNPSRNQFD